MKLQTITNYEDFSESQLNQDHLQKFSFPYFEPFINNLSNYFSDKYFWFILNQSNFKIEKSGGNFELSNALKNENSTLEKLLQFVAQTDLLHLYSYAKFSYDALMEHSPEQRRGIRPFIYFNGVYPNGTKAYFVFNFIEWIFDEKGDIAYSLLCINDITKLVPVDSKPKLVIYNNIDGVSKVYFTHSPQDESPNEKKIKLTKRQKQIIALLAKGMSSKQVAESLDISVYTVNNHRKKIIADTGFSNINAVIGFVSERGMLKDLDTK